MSNESESQLRQLQSVDMLLETVNGQQHVPVDQYFFKVVDCRLNQKPRVDMSGMEEGFTSLDVAVCPYTVTKAEQGTVHITCGVGQQTRGTTHLTIWSLPKGVSPEELKDVLHIWDTDLSVPVNWSVDVGQLQLLSPEAVEAMLQAGPIINCMMEAGAVTGATNEPYIVYNSDPGAATTVTWLEQLLVVGMVSKLYNLGDRSGWCLTPQCTSKLRSDICIKSPRKALAQRSGPMAEQNRYEAYMHLIENGWRLGFQPRALREKKETYSSGDPKIIYGSVGKVDINVNYLRCLASAVVLENSFGICFIRHNQNAPYYNDLCNRLEGKKVPQQREPEVAIEDDYFNSAPAALEDKQDEQGCGRKQKRQTRQGHCSVEAQSPCSVEAQSPASHSNGSSTTSSSSSKDSPDCSADGLSPRSDESDPEVSGLSSPSVHLSSLMNDSEVRSLPPTPAASTPRAVGDNEPLYSPTSPATAAAATPPAVNDREAPPLPPSPASPMPPAGSLEEAEYIESLFGPTLASEEPQPSGTAEAHEGFEPSSQQERANSRKDPLSCQWGKSFYITFSEKPRQRCHVQVTCLCHSKWSDEVRCVRGLPGLAAEWPSLRRRMKQWALLAWETTDKYDHQRYPVPPLDGSVTDAELDERLALLQIVAVLKRTQPLDLESS
jgi:hypothetical protein